MGMSLLDTKTLCGHKMSCVLIFLSMSPYFTAIFRHFCACASCPDGKSDAERGIFRTHCTPSGALARNVFDHSPFPSKDFSSYCRPCSSLMISPAFIIVFSREGVWFNNNLYRNSKPNYQFLMLLSNTFALGSVLRAQRGG